MLGGLNFTSGVIAASRAYAANPVHFDGTNDYLLKSSDLTGAADGTLWTGSLWVRRTGGEGATIVMFNGTNEIPTFRFISNNKIQARARNAAGTTVLDTTSTAITGTEWHHVMWSFDLTDTAKRHLYVDGVSDLTVLTYTTTETMDFTRNNWAFGARETAAHKLNADAADFQNWFGVYVDLSQLANRELFLKDGKPVDPAVAAASLGDPIVAFYGATNDWHTNRGTGGGFTLNGALTDGTGPVVLP